MYIAITILFILLLVSIYYCIKFALIIINVQEAIEESLDIIDKRYERINKILEVPVFYNSPEVKSALADIEDSRDALLYIANILVRSTVQEEEDFEQQKENTTDEKD